MIVEILKNFERLNILKKNKKKITLPARYFTHPSTSILHNTSREHFQRDFLPVFGSRPTEKRDDTLSGNLDENLLISLKILWESLNQSELEIVLIFNSRVVSGAAQVHLPDRALSLPTEPKLE